MVFHMGLRGCIPTLIFALQFTILFDRTDVEVLGSSMAEHLTLKDQSKRPKLKS